MVDGAKHDLDHNQKDNDAFQPDAVLMLQIVNQRVDDTLDVRHFFVQNFYSAMWGEKAQRESQVSESNTPE